MWINLVKKRYLLNDMRAALDTGARMARELERYCREAETVLAEVKAYVDDPETPEQKFVGFPHDFERVARLAGQMDHVVKLFDQGFTEPYKTRMDECVAQLISYWTRVKWRNVPPDGKG